ncbi:hypothetical protein [[Flexibacter] sp. ATCC 35208]|uniref:hypothetical protein n=1 Tax=[Flexibacter] sp. ATCC 35208 TaxID=1936242 RepID=UPI0009CBF164|nr:hypothetical protein [[Flexibacter] sp. ATCC 35208]OMP81160.1 hypothetical protein BW716_00815 [[Flexibacter] sp. ATCC 35208]
MLIFQAGWQYAMHFAESGSRNAEGVAGLNEYKDIEPDHLLTGNPALKGKVLELVNACPYF